jgi:putative hydrolase of the HAD superfamily
MTIRAVFFDMGGTLETYGWTPELRLQQTAGIQQLLARVGINLCLTDPQLYKIISSGLDAYHRTSLQTMEELTPQRVWSEFVFMDYHVDQEKLAAIAEDMMCFLEMHYYQRIMRPEVPAVLEAIRMMGLKIGLISNVNSRGQVPANLGAYGIRDYFDPLVLSSVYGRRKPDPAIFHHAARLAGVPTSACVFIGDRISRDILGAKRAGYSAAIQILHDYDHREADDGATPDAVISNMTELVDILKKRTRRSLSTRQAADRQKSTLRAFLFDAGDILYFRPDRGRNFQAFLEETGLAQKAVPEATVKTLRQQAFHGSISQDEFRQAILGLYDIADPEQIARGKQAMDEDDNNVQFFQGVRDTLLALKKDGYMLGIVTDTANPLHVKLKWFENGGFVHVWDTIISSHELGIQKPTPGIYLAALQQLGLPACQAVFVGHDVDELDGAHSVGMKTVAFNYDERARADFYIDQFSDLLKVPIISRKKISLIGRENSG